MAITDIISEEFETRDPNMEVAQGGPEDFMTEDEMDPYQDPEFQQLLESLPMEQAEVLMQLIKEFKAMVAQGFRGEFEDFVKMKMSTAQGGSEEDFMTEEEMVIPDEELQSMVPMGQQVAQGGRIGYYQGGGIMDVDVEEQIQTGPTTQQLILKYLQDRGLPITPENIQKAIMEMSRAGRTPAMTGRPQIEAPQMEMPRPPTGADYVPQEFIGQDITETVTPDVATMNVMTEEVVPQGDEIMQTDDPIFYKEDEQKIWNKKLKFLKSLEGGIGHRGWMNMVSEHLNDGLRGGIITKDQFDTIISPLYGQAGEVQTRALEKDDSLSINDLMEVYDENRQDYPPYLLAGGGRAGYQNGNEVTADTSGIISEVSPYAEGNQMAETALKKIYDEFRERFPEADEDDLQQMIRNMIAEEQVERVIGTEGLGILGLDRAISMITPESVDTSVRAMDRHGRFDDSPEEHPFDHPIHEIRYGNAYGGRAGYGLGSLVKSVTKGVKSLTKSIKKFAKSDLGKAALMYMATAGMGNILQPGAASWAKPFTKGAGTGWLRPGTVFSNYSNLFKGSPEVSKAASKLTSAPTDSIWAQTVGQNYLKPTPDKTNFLAGLGKSFVDHPFPWIAGTAGLAGLYTHFNPGKDNIDNLMANYKGEVKDWDDMIASIRAGQGSTPFATDNITLPYPDYMNLAAEGGRIGRAEGGLMDLGGLEKDYRAEGGFVPIGKKEKADDVPARLSVNEFVFTADAVRNAGGGDVDKGAEVMENVMTNLEQGGSISEESQGLEGARNMFEVSERLSEVV
jgi:hypothetical protein